MKYLLCSITILLYAIFSCSAQILNQDECDSVENWDVKGHYNVGEYMNNEVKSFPIDIYWEKNKGKGIVKITKYTNTDTSKCNPGFGDWLLMIECAYKVVDPLILHYYYEPKLVYEGDLDRDGVPDFGILLRRHSNCCAYVLLTIKDRRWVKMCGVFPVAANLRESGRELADIGDKKGEIKIVKTDFGDDDTCAEAGIKDTVIINRRIPIEIL